MITRSWTATVLVASLALPSAAQFKPGFKDQVELGQRVAADLRKKEKVLPGTDPRVQLIRKLGTRLSEEIPEAERKKKPWAWSFDVIDSKEINAFALPGGPVFFYTGLLDKLKTEDAIAGVMAHELTHVREEHWATQYNDDMKRQVGVGLLLSLLGANRTLTNLASLVDTFAVGLPYSRKFETRADEGGFKLVVGAGYNPQGMVDVFKMLSESSGSKPPEFMSDHPDDKKRVKRLEEMTAKSGKSYGPQKALPESVTRLKTTQKN